MADHISVVKGPFGVAEISLGVEHWYRAECSDCPWARSAPDSDAALDVAEEHTVDMGVIERLERIDRAVERLGVPA